MDTMERSGLTSEISEAHRLHIIRNGSGIHLILKIGREYTFNCDDPKTCIRTLQIDTQETKDEENLMTNDLKSVDTDAET